VNTFPLNVVIPVNELFDPEVIPVPVIVTLPVF